MLYHWVYNNVGTNIPANEEWYWCLGSTSSDPAFIHVVSPGIIIDTSIIVFLTRRGTIGLYECSCCYYFALSSSSCFRGIPSNAVLHTTLFVLRYVLRRRRCHTHGNSIPQSGVLLDESLSSTNFPPTLVCRFLFFFVSTYFLDDDGTTTTQ